MKGFFSKYKQLIQQFTFLGSKTNVMFSLEIVMNELQRFKHSAVFFANSSHIIESAAISSDPLALRNIYIKK